MSHIDYLIDKVVLLYLKEPIEYSVYDDVYSFGVLTHHHKRQVFHQFITKAVVIKVKDITFFGLLVQLHRSIELVNIEFSNIVRISEQYKWLFDRFYNENLRYLEANKDKERFVMNLDTDFVEWADNKEPNLIPNQEEDNEYYSPDIRSPLHEDNQNDSE